MVKYGANYAILLCVTNIVYQLNAINKPLSKMQ